VGAGARILLSADLYIPGMLRMCKKRPADLTNVNSGMPWSPMDLADPYDLVETTSVADIADYLCRDVDEVERKIASLRH
jgi:hypothetical protein